MHLHTAGVLDLLTAKTGRYIEEHHGHYVMKEGDGANVFVIEDGRRLHIQPTQSQIEDLVEKGHLIKDGSRYELS
jgi:hypothetical protein